MAKAADSSKEGFEAQPLSQRGIDWAAGVAVEDRGFACGRDQDLDIMNASLFGLASIGYQPVARVRWTKSIPARGF